MKIGSTSNQPGRPRSTSIAALLLLTAAIALAGCGSEPAVSEDVRTDRAAEKINDLALEARRLQEETAQAGRRLVERPEQRDEARARLRELAGDARDLGAQVRREAPRAPEAQSVRRAAERVERGAEQLLAFARSKRGDLVVTARESLDQADRELDGVADRLDLRLDEDARRDLDALRREVPSLPSP